MNLFRSLVAALFLVGAAPVASQAQVAISGGGTPTICLADYTTNSTAVNTTSASATMNGYGVTWTCTPTGSKLLVTAQFAIRDSSASGQNLDFGFRYGVGTPPAKNGGVAGVPCGRNYGAGNPFNYGHSANFPVTVQCYVTGLTPGVPVWFDTMMDSPDNVSQVFSFAPSITVFNY